MRACPSPLTSVSRSTRTTTVVFASGVRVWAQPSVWRASAASASAWICGIDRRSSATGVRSPSAGSRRRSTSLTSASIAAFTGAALSGSRRACRCTMPRPSSRIVSERSMRSSSSRGSTPSGSSRASASRTPRMSVSSGTCAASSTSAASTTSTLLALGPHRRPVEHRGDRGCRLDADRRGLHGGCDVRMPRGEALATEGLALRGDGADGDQPQRVGARCSGGRGDESRRVVESLRLRQPDIAELGPGSLRHLGGDPGEHGVDVAPDLRERIGDLHEPGVAHLLHFDLRGPTDSAPRRHRARPRLAQRRDVALERGAAPAARAAFGCGGGGCSMLRSCTHPLTFDRRRKPAMIR